VTSPAIDGFFSAMNARDADAAAAVVHPDVEITLGCRGAAHISLA
jgi:hypothetical protein